MKMRKEMRKKKNSWSQVGIYVINSKINNRPSQSKDNKSPYEFADTMSRSEKENYDVNEELQKVVYKYLRGVFDEDTINAARGRGEAQEIEQLEKKKTAHKGMEIQKTPERNQLHQERQSLKMIRRVGRGLEKA